MKVLYYFRNDFRLHDNPLLTKALIKASKISFMAQKSHDHWGKWRKKFYDESLLCLNQNLNRFGHHLNLLSSEDVQKLKFDTFDILYTPKINAIHEDREYRELKNRVTVISEYNDRLLETLPYSSVQDLPDVFTEFRKKVEKSFLLSPAIQPPKNWPPSLKISNPSGLHCENDLNQIELIPHPNSAFPFKGGETAGIERVDDYFFKNKNILTYKKTRNGLVGRDYSTKLSPYLALGCLSAKDIYRKVEDFEKNIHKNQDTYWVKFELWWREYFRWVYEKYQIKLFMKNGIKGIPQFPNKNEDTFFQWKEGLTNNSFVDASMNELRLTGWMSNRGRQNVASFLVKDLNLPWWWGAEYFEDQLIDYDVFSNWGNWQYVAGVGNDPRPNRYFNTHKQAAVYDENGTFRSLWATPKVSPID